jgi:hypothetical protein
MPTHPYTGRNGTMAWVVTCKQKHRTFITVPHASNPYLVSYERHYEQKRRIQKPIKLRACVFYPVKGASDDDHETGGAE